ncbi:diacylglycerol/lipid kinase family protein [Nannocystis punicea]|uniref:Diacylglycerol kinase family lipid kinase n=1 Tax=Nannocystis punicea TaxID=2995304 RepID=A0ABY7H3R6_9BACT|nr:diacylglycerol kinase family protein [Nannocystis poenicansa]WAS93740.1 diacylglycerol kinase family lipid kinase [Nannocystis poenicansa]
MRARAIVNPNSSRGRLARAWPDVHARLQAALGPVEVAFTDAPMAAARLTREALRDGVELVIACGGDGTNNEVVNGFFEPPRPGAPDVRVGEGAALSILMLGTGGDFRKSFGAAGDVDAQVRRIAEGKPRPLDVGRLDYVADDGSPAARYFINIASFGVSGVVDREVNKARLTKLFGGKFTYFAATVRGLLRYRPTEVVMRVDDGPELKLVVNTAAVCNGRYFGGGMHVAPMADPSDGRLEVIVMHDMGLLDFIKDPNAIYRGEHLKNPKVRHLSGARVEARAPAGAEVLLDVDGEAPGRLPATFTVLPGALTLRY